MAVCGRLFEDFKRRSKFHLIYLPVFISLSHCFRSLFPLLKPIWQFTVNHIKTQQERATTTNKNVAYFKASSQWRAGTVCVCVCAVSVNSIEHFIPAYKSRAGLLSYRIFKVSFSIGPNHNSSLINQLQLRL